MAFKTSQGAITVSITVNVSGNFKIMGTAMNASTHYLVIGASCLDANSVRRRLDCSTDQYGAYITGVSGAEALNGHASLVPIQCPIDDSALFQAGVDYNWSRLTGINGTVSQAYVTIMCYA